MNKYSISFLSFLILSCSNSTDYSLSEDQTNDPSSSRIISMPKMEEGDADIQLAANNIYTIILDNLRNNKDDAQLPDFFGGGYTDNTGNLFVMIKGDFHIGSQIIKNIVNDPIIKIIPCNYSLQDLTDIIKTISSKIKSAPIEIQQNISVFYLADSANKVFVGLENADTTHIHDFENYIIKHDAIEFIDIKTKNQIRYNPLKTMIAPIFLNPGSLVSNTRFPIHQYVGSWAFRVRDKYDSLSIGMVTAAHLPLDSVFFGGYYVGMCTLPIFTDEVDASLVEMGSTNFHYFPVPTNTLATEYVNGPYPSHNEEVELDTATNLPIAGTIINKRGWTTGLTTGVVISSNYCATFWLTNGQMRVINNMTSSSYVAEDGDSGGIVYTYYSSLNKRYTTGIHLGTIPSTRTTIFTKAKLALQALGVERY